MDAYEELSLVRQINMQKYKTIKEELIKHKLNIAKNENINNKLELYNHIDSIIQMINDNI